MKVWMFRMRMCLVAKMGLAALLLTAAPVSAQSLGGASSFTVAGASGVIASGGVGTIITGNVGSSPSASIVGFPPAIVSPPPYALHVNDGAAMAAEMGAVNLFTALNAGSCTDAPIPQMSAANFGPGIHCFSSAADLAASGSMTLTGTGIYIFRVPTALTANVSSTVVLSGVDPCAVFWQVGTAAVLNGITFAGNVVAQTGITLGIGAGLAGRALATAGPVTLSGADIVGGCAAAAVPTLPGPTAIVLTLLLALAGITAMRRRDT